eukprot:m.240335 g.240335  ORF g.240335 m.240335 type:complete len:619 (+) comp26277_c0_seq12:995-2851(+)
MSPVFNRLLLCVGRPGTWGSTRRICFTWSAPKTKPLDADSMKLTRCTASLFTLSHSSWIPNSRLTCTIVQLIRASPKFFQVISAVLKFQATPYALPIVAVVQERMSVDEYPIDDKKAIKAIEDRAYARSQEVEPREKPKTLPFPPRNSAVLPVARDDSDLMSHRLAPAKKGHRKAKSLGNALFFQEVALLCQEREGEIYTPPRFSRSIEPLRDASSPAVTPNHPSASADPPVLINRMSNASFNLETASSRTPSVCVTEDAEGPDGPFMTLAEVDTSDDDDVHATGMNPPDLVQRAVPPPAPAEFLFEGPLQKKGSRLHSYRPLWVALTRAHLMFFARKDKGVGRAAYSSRAFKLKSIYGAVLMIGDPSLDRKFALRLNSGKILQFKAESAQARSQWLVALRSCLGIAAADVMQMKTPMTPPVGRRYFGAWKKSPQLVRKGSGSHANLGDTLGQNESAPPSQRSPRTSRKASPLVSPNLRRQSPDQTPTADPKSILKPRAGKEAAAAPSTSGKTDSGNALAPTADLPPQSERTTAAVDDAATAQSVRDADALAMPPPALAANGHFDEHRGPVTTKPPLDDDHSPIRTQSSDTVWGFGNDSCSQTSRSRSASIGSADMLK